MLDGVRFDYPSGARAVLEDVHLVIRPGETVAVVGENGAGKTTLVKLLCRLYVPTKGRVTIDGIDLRDLASRDVRRAVSVIFQDHAWYHLTARDNIWFGNLELPADDPRLYTAAGETGADEVVRRLKHGYDTILGRSFEDGEELSAGQWQRIALARAFVRDAQIVVLDEPTRSLDAKAEHDFFMRFRELARGRMTLLISHRFSTVRLADRIYVLEEGRIAEAGSHADLVRRDGVYARLFALQAQQYR